MVRRKKSIAAIERELEGMAKYVEFLAKLEMEIIAEMGKTDNVTYYNYLKSLSKQLKYSALAVLSKMERIRRELEKM